MITDFTQTGSSELGRKAEEAVSMLLTHKGFREVTRNYPAHGLGELDLVFLKEDRLFFVEVRLRKQGGNFGGPAESIGPQKRKRIFNAAKHLIGLYGLNSYETSFWAGCIEYSSVDNRFTVKFVPF